MAIEVALILGYDAMGGVVPAIRAVKAASLIPIVVLNESDADYSAWLPDELILKSANVNSDHQALVQEILQLGRLFGSGRIHVKAIINNQDRMWLCYLDLRRAFPGAAGIPPDAIVRTSVKPNLRFLLRGTRYDVPYVLLPKRHLQAPRLLQFPPLAALAAKAGSVIVKPAAGAAGAGVSRVDYDRRFEENLRAAARNALATQRGTYGDRITAPFLELGSRRHPVNNFVLIEKYIEGLEYSMEGLAGSNGAAHYLVEQRKTKRVENPIFRDLEYLVNQKEPSRRTEEAVSDLLRTVGFSDFPFHIELKGSAKMGLKLVEFNPRMGGGSIGDLVFTIHSVDLRRLGIKKILNGLKLNSTLVTVVVQPERTGKIRRYIGIEKVQRQLDCVFVKILVPEGTHIGRLDRESYLVEFCVSGKDAAMARQRANELLSWIFVEIGSAESHAVGWASGWCDA